LESERPSVSLWLRKLESTTLNFQCQFWGRDSLHQLPAEVEKAVNKANRRAPGKGYVTAIVCDAQNLDSTME